MSERSGPRSSGYRSRRGIRWASAVPLLAVCALAIPSLLSPTAAAASPGGHVFRAPYLHTIPEVGPQSFTAFCHSSATYPTAGAANASTGNVSAAIRVVSAGCGQQYAQASASIGLGFAGPTFRASTNQTVNVTFNWTVHWSANLSVALANASSTFAAYSFLQVYQEDFVFDKTTTAFAGFVFANIYSNQIFNGSVLLSHVTNQSLASTTATLIAGHLYDFEPMLWITILTFANPGDSGRCLFDLASHGNGARLNSITVS